MAIFDLLSAIRNGFHGCRGQVKADLHFNCNVYYSLPTDAVGQKVDLKADG